MEKIDTKFFTTPVIELHLHFLTGVIEGLLTALCDLVELIVHLIAKAVDGILNVVDNIPFDLLRPPDEFPSRLRPAVRSH